MIGGSGLDYLADERRRDLELADRITAECNRPVPPYDRLAGEADGLDVGPTEAWRLHLALTDPDLQADEDCEVA